MSKFKVKAHVDIFKCPICGSRMDLYQLKSLVCKANHCFDLARSGYVNFLLRAAKTGYDKSMLRSRNIICKSNFFKPLLVEISELLLQEIPNDGNKKLILDIGCGEGSHLNQILSMLRSKTSHVFEGVGVDISKEGIQIASKEYPEHVWCVGDLANNPFQSNKFAVILNILSPSNYAEFNRLLLKNGILIKVVPGANYLKELREAFYTGGEKQTYSNTKTVEHFKEKFALLDLREILYFVNINRADLEHLIKMTPLSWNVPTEKIEQVIRSGLNKITVEFTILYGKKCFGN
ncbi:MAG TPA: methyltransferase domain-containing protein [Clostridia bacterium]|nr:methyltransferase domain-containing protein [Clostridia bacterium]